MHHVATGKIEHTPGGHEAASPLPVAERAVDEKMPGSHEDEHRSKSHALGKGTRDNRLEAAAALAQFGGKAGIAGREGGVVSRLLLHSSLIIYGPVCDTCIALYSKHHRCYHGKCRLVRHVE